MSKMRWLSGACLCAWLWTLNPLAVAQTMDRAQIEMQKLQLQKEREDIMRSYEASVRQCWQRFMVNDCLREARKQKYLALSPIEKQEQALRAAQRALTAIEREERLQAKQPKPEMPHADRP